MDDDGSMDQGRSQVWGVFVFLSSHEKRTLKVLIQPVPLIHQCCFLKGNEDSLFLAESPLGSGFYGSNEIRKRPQNS
jgi:hypothetical protein